MVYDLKNAIKDIKSGFKKMKHFHSKQWYQKQDALK